MPLPLLAHALPVSIGAVPLTAVLTLAVAVFLAVGALGTSRAGARTVQPARQRHDDGPDVAGEPSGPIAPVDMAVVEPDVPTAPQDVPRPFGQGIGVIALLVIVALAVLGPADAATNLTDQAVLTLLWGAVALSSIAFGGWWWRVDPMAGIARGVAAAAGDSIDRERPPLPDALATARAVSGLLFWASAQILVTPTVAAFQAMILVYVVVQVAATLRYGPVWLRQAESLTVLSGTMGLLRPGGGGPLRRLTEAPDTGHLRWICAALIGWSATDLIIETDAWHDLGDVAWAGPVVLIGSVVVLRGLISAVSGRFPLGPAFVAVAGGWTAAHYLSVLLIEGQGIPIWLSDPFGTGADLLGRRGDLIDLEPLPLWAMAVLQTIPFVVGHLVAVVVAQRRAAVGLQSPGQIGTATFMARTLIGVLLVAGLYAQLGGV